MEKTGPSVGDPLNVYLHTEKCLVNSKWTTEYFILNLFIEQQREPFKKRWFILDGLERKLLYFKTELVR